MVQFCVQATAPFALLTSWYELQNLSNGINSSNSSFTQEIVVQIHDLLFILLFVVLGFWLMNFIRNKINTHRKD
jgi:flagellar biogenesis protein FliO